MSLQWLVYWFSVLGNLHDFFRFVGVLGTVLMVISAIIYFFAWSSVSKNYRDEETYELWRWINKRFAPPFIVILLISFFLPSERTMYVMVAASAAQTVVQNDQVSDVAREGMDVMKLFLAQERKRLIESVTK